MKFIPKLEQATLIRRYKRFLADIETYEGEKLTIHCPNTGSMLNCMVEGGQIWFNRSNDKNRKTAGSWILAQTPQNRLACINTHLANTLVIEALNKNIIIELKGFNQLRQEVRYGQENSRIDLCLTYPDQTLTYVEIKSVTLGFDNNDIAAFPDAVTARGAKHLRELTLLAQQGINAVLLYCVNLTGVHAVRAYSEIDSSYAESLKKAQQAGVKILAYQAAISDKEIFLAHRLPVII